MCLHTFLESYVKLEFIILLPLRVLGLFFARMVG